MDDNFTPGPWRVLHKTGVFPVDTSSYAIGVAEQHRKNHKANAVLMASAPDLLATAIKLADICDRSFAPSAAALNRGSAGWVEGREMREAVDAARAAIARAIGEA